MGRQATSQTAPLEFWDGEPGHKQDQATLPRLLHALANRRRLGVLRSLAGGKREPAEIASELGISPAQVRKDLATLTEVGLVRADSDSSGDVYQLAQHAVRLLQSALTYGTVRSRPRSANGKAASLLPIPPLACTVCDNRDFVSQVLSQLNVALIDTRQYHRRIKEMSSQVLTAHEAERMRIARELHDDTAQALTSILVRLHLLERSTSDPAVLGNVEELRELTSGALDSVRRMAMDLRPAALDDLGLVSALHTYAGKFSESWPTKVTVNVTGLRRRLRPEVELVLYRVVQEALTNIAKHASATSAHVSLTRRRNDVTLIVEDDGQGFNVGDRSEADGTGLGLFGMQERLALVGGEARIESVKGSGTRITAHVPLAGPRSKTRRAK